MIENGKETSTALTGMTRRQFIGKMCLAIPAVAILGMGLSGCDEYEDYDDEDTERRRRRRREEERREAERREGLSDEERRERERREDEGY